MYFGPALAILAYYAAMHPSANSLHLRRPLQQMRDPVDLYWRRSASPVIFAQRYSVWQIMLSAWAEQNLPTYLRTNAYFPTGVELADDTTALLIYCHACHAHIRLLIFLRSDSANRHIVGCGAQCRTGWPRMSCEDTTPQSLADAHCSSAVQ